jgi:hypothetical protein
MPLVTRRLAAGALIGCAALPAAAQTVGISAINNNPNIENVTAAVSGVTEFRVATNGSVSVASGTGSRQTVGNVVNTITLTCTGGSNSPGAPCNANNVRVRVTPTTAVTGRAQQLNGLQIALGAGTSYAAGGTPSYAGEAVTFTIQPITRGGTKTFRLGLDMPITGGFGPSGVATAAYTVQAGFTPNLTASQTGTARAVTRNGTSIAKTSDLAFGAILPLSGQTSTVTIDATTGARSRSNAGVLLRPSTTSRALYSIQGERGQVISVSVPLSFQMTGPGAPITVNLVSTADPGLIVGGDAGGEVIIPGAAGNSGSTSLGVGGSFTVTGPMTAGNYSGTFNVVFNWN